MSNENIDETPNAVPMTVIEEAARQQGWSPEKGEKTALQFLADGREYRDRLFEKLEKSGQENEKLLGVISEYIVGQKNEKIATQQEAIKAQIREATEAGDSDKVLELTGKLSEIEPAVQIDPNQEYVDSWKSENKWFSEDADMRDDALGFYKAEEIRLGRDDPKTILPKVKAKIEKVYKDYFNPPDNPNKKRGAGADKGGKQNKGSNGLTKDDLTETERKHFDDFVKAGISEEKLLRSIQNERARHAE